MPVRRTAATVAIVAAIAFAQAAPAAVERPFAARYSANLRGDLTTAANTLLTCPDAGGTEAQCLAAREGVGGNAALNNNGYAMELVDVDGEAATFASSGATLSLPAGATVEFAGLYYGARLTAGTGGKAAPNASMRGSVQLQAPGAPSYATLGAEVDDSAAISGAYTAFADVTAIVAAAGAGEYRVADVQAGGGEDRYGGWALVVAYRDEAAQPRSLRVFDGLASIEQGDPPLDIGVSGLETPTAGTVNAEIGVVAYEGDRGAGGDRLSLDGQSLSDAVNPVNNVFNSSIAAGGLNRGEKTPDYVNQLGFDADAIGADGVLGNGETTATLSESTTLEQYLTQVLTTSIELDPTALEPTVEPITTPPTVVPAPSPESVGGKKKSKDDNKAKPGGDEKSPQLTVDVDAPGRAPPSAVVGYRIEVTAAGSLAKDIEICNRVPKSLVRLTAPRGAVRGSTACWHTAKLPAGASRSYVTTVRVDADDSTTLGVRTVVTAGNARTRRSVSHLRVSPLPLTPCLRPRRIGAGTATISC